MYSTTTDTNTPYHKSFSRTIEIPPSFVQEFGNAEGKRASLEDTRSRGSSVSSSTTSDDGKAQQLVDQLAEKVKNFLIENNCNTLLESVTINVKPKDKRNEEHVVNLYTNQSNQEEWQLKSHIKKSEKRFPLKKGAADAWDPRTLDFDDALPYDTKPSTTAEDSPLRPRSRTTNESLSEGTALSPSNSRTLDSDNVHIYINRVTVTHNTVVDVTSQGYSQHIYAHKERGIPADKKVL